VGRVGGQAGAAIVGIEGFPIRLHGAAVLSDWVKIVIFGHPLEQDDIFIARPDKAMKRKTCEQLLTIETVSFAFKNHQLETSEQIISCFYSCYQSMFVKWAKITYQHYPPDVIEFAANNAFTDGVLKFRESAGNDKLYQTRASVKTVLFHYCRNILLGHLTQEKRLAEKNRKLEPFLSSETGVATDEAEREARERRHAHLMKALSLMLAADRQIIQWRHIEEKSNDEIARLLAITVASATNRIYRCMQRLRELVDEMDKKGTV
jgi:RNA polymerase sigma factor (sigma-70 family)